MAPVLPFKRMFYEILELLLALAVSVVQVWMVRGYRPVSRYRAWRHTIAVVLALEWNYHAPLPDPIQAALFVILLVWLLLGNDDDRWTRRFRSVKAKLKQFKPLAWGIPAPVG